MADRSIEKLHPLFQGMVSELLFQGNKNIKDTGYTLFITDGFRSFDEQNELFKQGRSVAGKIVTNAKGGESAHNFGLAVDLAFQKDGKLSYLASLYNKVYPTAKTLGFELGAEWSTFPDKTHFEYPNWEKEIKKPIPPSGGGQTMDTIPVDKATFEKLVEKSTKYDSLVSAGVSSPTDIEQLKRDRQEANDQLGTARDEAKATREALADFKTKVAEKLQSTQDLERVLSAIDEVIKDRDLQASNSKKDSEELTKAQAKIVDLNTELTRVKLMFNSKNPLEQASAQELLIELLSRLTKILKKG